MKKKVNDIIFGRYEIHKVLEGGMGYVYIIYDPREKMVFALKTFKDDLLWNEDSNKLFLKEVEKWINLGKYTNIVFANYAMELEGKIHIFLEYVDGGNLSGKIGNLHTYEIIDISIQTARGLTIAHNKGIIHQDIKPSNILITTKGVAKITDFGTAGVIPLRPKIIKDSNKYNVSIKGSSFLTIEYASPEQIKNRYLTIKSDIWSWAVTVLEMFIGYRTWEIGSESKESFNDYINSDNNRMPLKLINILNKCLRKNPDKRPKSMKEITSELINLYETIANKKYDRIAIFEKMDDIDWMNRGSSYMQIKMYENAYKCFKKGLLLNPKKSEILSNLSSTLFLLNKDQKAKIYADKALKINPYDVVAIYIKGMNLTGKKQYKKAIEYFDFGLQYISDKKYYELEKIQLLIGKSESLRISGLVNEALSYINKALEIKPKSAEILTQKAIILTNSGQLYDAIEALDKAISFNINYAEAWKRRGLALSLLGAKDHKVTRYKDAIKCFEKVLESDPLNVGSLIGKAECLYILEEDNNAIQCFRKALAISQKEGYKKEYKIAEGRLRSLETS